MSLSNYARLPNLIAGGGTISVSGTGEVKWSARYVLMGLGREASGASSGYYDIAMPAVGSVIFGAGGLPNVTVTSGGIPLASWGTLYAVISPGGNAAVSFVILGYTAEYKVPSNWVPLIRRNDDNVPNSFAFPNGYKLIAGDTVNVADRYNTRAQPFSISTPAIGTGQLIINTISGDGGRLAFTQNNVTNWLHYVTNAEYTFYNATNASSVLTLTPTSATVYGTLAITGASATVNGGTVWHSGNFTPATKANLNTDSSFRDITASRGDASGVIYFGNTGTRYLFYTGSYYNLPSADLLVGGGIRTNGTVTVGEGATSSLINMIDTDNGTRYVHCNSGYIGFLSNASAWSMRVSDNGQVWTAEFGDLGTRIESRAQAWASEVRLRAIYAGDGLKTSPSALNSWWEPFAGAFVSGYFQDANGIAGLRFRQMQIRDVYGNYYACAFG